MPLYEYYCTDCRTKFSALRSMSKADAPIECKACESTHTSRVLSLFAAHSKGASQTSQAAPQPMNMGGGCCGGGMCGCAH